MESQFFELPTLRGNHIPTIEALKMAKDFMSSNYSSVNTKFGSIRTQIITERQCLFHEPPAPTSHPTLLIHLHGSRGYCWNQALFKTRWIELSSKYNMIVAFPQAEGIEAEPHIHQHYGGVSFGERYWEIRDSQTVSGFQKDLDFVKGIIQYAKDTYAVDKVILSGHSNGGVFVCLMAVYIKHLLAGVYSSMGGIGWDPNFQIDFDRAEKKNSTNPRFFFLTGDEDVHKKPTQIAYDLFIEENYQSKLEILPNTKHVYQDRQEEQVLKWLLE